MEAFGWTSFFEELENVINSCEPQIGTASDRFVEYITQKLEFGLRNVQRIQQILQIAIEPESELQPEEVVTKYLELTTNLKSCILTLLSYWDVYLEKRNTHTQYQTMLLYSGMQGRPSFSIHRSQLEYHRQLSFSWTEIADLVGRLSLRFLIWFSQICYRIRSWVGTLVSILISQYLCHSVLTS